MNTRRLSAWLVWLAVAPLWAQVGVSPYKTPVATFTDANGAPLALGCVFTYAGGTSTPQPTYTDYTGTTQNPDPVTLDASGSAVLWLGPYAYKFVVDAASPTGSCALNPGPLVRSVDQVPGNVYLNATLSGGTLENSTIVGGTIDNACVGCTTPAPVYGSFLNGPIGTGGGAPAAGEFTQEWTPVDTVSFSATPVFPASSYGTFILTLSGNVTSSTITGGATGQSINFELCQNATGGYTFAWPANMVNAPTVPATASVCITPQFFYDGANWQYLNNTATATGGAYDNVTWSATPTFAVNPAYYFGLTLSGNVTGSTITGSAAGEVIGFNVCQNATGGFTFAWPASFVGAPAMPLAPSACIAPQFFSNGTNWTLLTPNPPLSAQTVTFSTTPTFNAAGYNAFTLTLSANVTSSTLTGGVAGQWIALNICQNATGGFTFAWPANLLNAPTVNTAPSACTNVLAINNGASWLTASATGAPVVTQSNCLSSSCAGGSTYAAGTIYTNKAVYAVNEEVTMVGTGSCTGADSNIQGFVGGVSVASNGFDNSCGNSYGKSVTFRVPPGATFEVVVTHIDGGGTYTISSWYELP